MRKLTGDISKTNRGFSLLELLIVVAIILIVATIAIPNFLRSRQIANENAAVAAMRVLTTAQMAYSASNGGMYGTINDLVASNFVDSRFGTSMSGYSYTVTLSLNSLDYRGVATALAPSFGRYDFYVAPDFVIRYSSDTTRAPLGLAGTPVRN
jgi:prepilin-type N-terminal cleavage/methylation domain-containing protein